MLPHTPDKHTTPRRVVDLDTAAERLGVSSKSIRRWIAEGRLTGYRVGPRMLRVDSAEVDALLSPIPTTASFGGDAA